MVLNGQLHASSALPSGKKIPVAIYIGGLVGAILCPDLSGKRKIF
jgi:hypothetical protein